MIDGAANTFRAGVHEGGSMRTVNVQPIGDGPAEEAVLFGRATVDDDGFHPVEMGSATREAVQPELDAFIATLQRSPLAGEPPIDELAAETAFMARPSFSVETFPGPFNPDNNLGHAVVFGLDATPAPYSDARAAVLALLDAADERSTKIPM